MKNYDDVADRPLAEPAPRVAIIGAGLAGLIAARTLVDHGLSVSVFEKSRGVGGRLATRRIDNELTIDHGAQYFTVRGDTFGRYVDSWINAGLVERWNGRIVELHNSHIVAEKSDVARFVGVPTMNTIARHLAIDIEVQRECKIVSLCPGGNEVTVWTLIDSQQHSHGPFEIVIANCPPVQAATLLNSHTSLVDKITAVEMSPCWCGLVRLLGEPLHYDAAFVQDNPLRWIARNDTKPGRIRAESCKPSSAGHWVLHASETWSETHLENAPESVAVELQKAFAKATGIAVDQVELIATHRWRYAIPKNVVNDECLYDEERGLGACGDWCGASRVEGAFTSGLAIAGAIVRSTTIPNLRDRN